MRLSFPPSLLLAAICLALLPTPVQAQGVLTGQIGDATGAGLPGVVVDAVGVSTFDERAVMEALLHEYPLRVGRRGPHFSGPSAGATLRG